MHAVVCLLRAGQVKPAGNAAESGQFVGEFSCDENVTPVLKGGGGGTCRWMFRVRVWGCLEVNWNGLARFGVVRLPIILPEKLI